MRRSVVALFFAISALSADAEAADPARATQLFDEGRDLLKSGNREEACARFRASFELDARVGTLLNLANCEEQGRELVLAHGHWEQAVALARATGDARDGFAAKRDAALVERIPTVTLRLDHAPADLRIQLDGASLPASAIGTAQRLDPGDHVLVWNGGTGDSQLRFGLAEREHRELVLQLAPPPSGPTASAPASSDVPPPEGPQPSSDRDEPTTPPAGVERPPWLLPVAYGIGAVAVAGVAVGTTYGIVAIQKKNASDANGDCSGNTCADKGGLGLRSDAATAAGISTAAFVIGGVAVVGDVALLLWGPRSARRAQLDPSLQVVAGPWGAALHGTF